MNTWSSRRKLSSRSSGKPKPPPVSSDTKPCSRPRSPRVVWQRVIAFQAVAGQHRAHNTHDLGPRRLPRGVSRRRDLLRGGINAGMFVGVGTIGVRDGLKGAIIRLAHDRSAHPLPQFTQPQQRQLAAQAGESRHMVVERGCSHPQSRGDRGEGHAAQSLSIGQLSCRRADGGTVQARSRSTRHGPPPSAPVARPPRWPDPSPRAG